MNIVGREVTDGTTKQSTFEKTKLPYDTIELERCRKEFKNRDAEQVGMELPAGVAQPLPEPFCVTINITGNVPLSQQSEP